MTEPEIPETAARRYAADELGWDPRTLTTASVDRGPGWSVVTFTSPDVEPEAMPFFVVEDSGRTHLEVVPGGRWFSPLERVWPR